jgi:hypothetical protein
MTDNSWPDPELPGVPLNPEKDGWHWVGGEPIFWQSDGEQWLVYDCYFQWKECGHKEYLGPCLTPAEVFEFASSVAMRERERCAQIASIFGQGKAGIEASKIIEKEIMNNDR